MRIAKWVSAATVAAALAVFPAKSQAGIFVNISIAPPAIPVYEQPFAPGPDYIWTPGFWQWDPNVGDYFWVPGTWVVAPQTGYLWTPGYWNFENGFYGWHGGYWGPHIGFYGGVNYGFGYFGRGYEGGYWNGPHFFYNTAITRVNVVNVHNTYVHNVTVVNNVHTSFVGGNGGLQSRPTQGEQAAFREQHVSATAVQQQHVNFARQDRGQFAQQNHGAPPAAALARPATSVATFHQAAVAGRPGGTWTPQPQQQQRGFANGNGQGVNNNPNSNRGNNGNGNGQAQYGQARPDNRQVVQQQQQVRPQEQQQVRPQQQQQQQVRPQEQRSQSPAQQQPHENPRPATEARGGGERGGEHGGDHGGEHGDRR